MASILDRDDLRQIKAIARWQAECSWDPTSGMSRPGWVGFKVRRAGIDALRTASQHRRRRPLTTVALSFDPPAAGDSAYERLEARLLVEAALARLTPEARSMVEETVMAGEYLTTWADQRGVNRHTAWGRMRQALRLLAETPEIQELAA